MVDGLPYQLHYQLSYMNYLVSYIVHRLIVPSYGKPHPERRRLSFLLLRSKRPDTTLLKGKNMSNWKTLTFRKIRGPPRAYLSQNLFVPFVCLSFFSSFYHHSSTLNIMA
jgi:hypothetical protein